MRRFLTPHRLVASVIVGALSLAGIAAISPAWAAEAGGSDQIQITLSPTKQRLDIAAGVTKDGTFTIYNNGGNTLTFRVYAAPYTVKSDANYTPVFTTDLARTQISRWVEFDQQQYTVEPGASTVVSYRVRVPASIPDGSQYAALFAETSEQSTGSVITKKRVGMLLYARPDGDTINRGDATFDPLGSWQFGGSMISTAKISNRGNTDFDTTVVFERTSVFGGSNQRQEQTRTVLPDSTRTITQTQSDNSLFAIYDVKQSATVFGKATSTTQKVYVISPALVIALGVVALLIIGGGIWRATHRQAKPSLGNRR